MAYKTKRKSWIFYNTLWTPHFHISHLTQKQVRKGWYTSRRSRSESQNPFVDQTAAASGLRQKSVWFNSIRCEQGKLASGRVRWDTKYAPHAPPWSQILTVELRCNPFQEDNTLRQKRRLARTASISIRGELMDMQTTHGCEFSLRFLLDANQPFCSKRCITSVDVVCHQSISLHQPVHNQGRCTLCNTYQQRLPTCSAHSCKSLPSLAG